MSRLILPPPAMAAVRLRARRAPRPGIAIRRIAFGLFAGTLLPLGAAAQSGPPAPGGLVNTGIIAGIIEDSLSTPVAGAQVAVQGLRGHGTSENDGSFRLASIPPGPHVLVVRRIGFRPESLAVTVAAGAIHEVRVRVRPKAQWVAPVVVQAKNARYTGHLRAFYERRDRGNGVFFTALDIEDRKPRYVSDLLRSVPGTRVTPRGPESVVTFRGRTCPPLIWVDGAAASAGYLDPDVIDPMTLEGIEIYKGPASVPAALMGMDGQGSCGVIALWTKRTEPRPKSRGKPVTAQDLANLAASLSIYTADQVDTPVGARSGTIAVEYPDALLSAAVSGRVVAEFVVDTLGQAEMDTFGAVSATHAQFTAAVRRAVAEGRFTPATLGNRKVRQLVQIPFSFVVPRT